MAQDGSGQMVRILITYGGILNGTVTYRQSMELDLQRPFSGSSFHACVHRLHLGVTVKSST